MVNVQFLKGVKGARAEMLASLGIRTVEDVAMLLPRSYEDRRTVRKICDAVPEESVRITGMVMKTEFRRIRNNFSVLNLRVDDGTGWLTVVFYNKDYAKSSFEKGETVTFFGKITRGYYGLEMVNPAYTLKENDPSFEGILPVYPLTKGLSQNVLRKIVKEALAVLPPFEDYLPEDIRKDAQLTGRDEAIRTIHNPKTAEEGEKARQRLAFDELFKIQVMLMLLKSSSLSLNSGIVMKPVPETDALINNLPFTLSGSQKKVWDDIARDMESGKQMNRLVMGDVGSGKTILAVLSMVMAIKNGYQSAYMAPTEILAEQHFTNITKYLSPFGIRCVLLTGSLKPKEKASVLSMIESGEAQCVIGTHALIQDKVKWHKTGIVITDEQHRFGVRQRQILGEQNTAPHILVMSATPIPRTLGLILYGDMDISRIDTLPSGRKPVITYVDDGRRRDRIYNWIIDLVNQGQQAYFVHPLVEPGETPESEKLLSATENYEKLSSSVFRDIPCGLIHGKMSQTEKDSVMKSFVKGDIKILFSTTVIEVGVDVANATVMVIENAERFGLAQLHQLRGRVGRSSLQSYCVLFPAAKISANPSPDDLISRRMLTIRNSTDGSFIAEEDMKLRGPGDFFGTSQHGLPQFSVANLYTDTDIMLLAQKYARQCISDTVKYASLISYIRSTMPKMMQL